jgi:WD40 repeat protein
VNVGLDVRPYKGLAPFDDAPFDALLFFGREREREIIVANLLASRLTVLYGPTGVGKSSLLRAGVAQRLRTYADASVTIVSVWTDDPTAQIDEAIAQADGEVYLILDQIEEYFLYHDPDDAFACRLPELVTEPGLRVNVLLGIREDALAKLDLFKRSIPNLFANYLRLDHLDRAAARAAIVGPLERLNELAPDEKPYRAEPELVHAVLEQVATGRIEYGLAGRGLVSGREEQSRVEAPFLQLVMERLWDVERAAGSRTLRRETLADLGEAETIVRRHLERALESLGPAQRALAADVFGHLVTPSGTKIAHDVGDLARYAHADEGEVDAVLGHLIDERIVRPVDGRDGDGRYEIFHDVLAEGVLAWRNSYEAERKLALERKRRQRALSVAGIALLALAAVAGIALYALYQRGQAAEREGSADARRLAATAAARLGTDPEIALLLAVEAARREPSTQVEDVLRQALQSSHVRRAFPGHVADVRFDGELLAVGTGERIELYELPSGLGASTLVHDAPVRTVRFEEGLNLVSLGGGRVHDWGIFQPGGGQSTFDDEDPVTSLAFVHLDGVVGWPAQPITSHADGSLRFWLPSPATDRYEVSHRRRLPEPVRFVVAARGRPFVAAVARDAAYVLRAQPGSSVRRLLHGARIAVAEFDPSGRLLVTAGGHRSAIVWSAVTGTQLRALDGHYAPVLDAEFSPDGSRVATASVDGVARIFDTATGDLVATLFGHDHFVTTIEYSGDGRVLATTSPDRTARVWDGQTGRLLAILRRHDAATTRAALSKDGDVLATSGNDGVVRVWDSRPEPELRLLRHLPFAPQTAWFTAGGRELWSQPPRGDAVAVNVADGRRRALARPARPTLVWSLDGQLRAAIRGRTVHFEHVGGRSTVLRGHRERVTTVAFSTDGERVLTTGADGDVRIWNTETMRLVSVIRAHFGPVADAAFSWDRRWIATAGPGAGGIFDASSGSRLAYVRGHEGPLAAISFVGKGHRIVSAGRDGTMRSYQCELCPTLPGLVALAEARLRNTKRVLSSAERERYLRD